MAAIVPNAAIPAVAPAGAAIIVPTELGVPINAPIIIAMPIVEPPSYNIDFETATAAVGMLPSLHPRPSHVNIRALE